MNKLTYVGLDVHARTIAIAVSRESEAVKYLGAIPHDVPKLKKRLASLGPASDLRIFYEAGPTGFGLCRALRDAGYHCEVIAPTLIPSAPGDRVKTDRRDAQKLAQFAQGGLLTPVHVPDIDQEGMRDLVRAREAAKISERKALQQLDKFLLRHGRRPESKITKRTMKYLEWVRSQKFTQPAQQMAFEEYTAEYEHQKSRVKRLDDHLKEQAVSLPAVQQAVVTSLVALKGVQFLTAVTLVAELGDISRFGHPTQLMAYAGMVPREHSSGDSVRKGTITKTGNARVRRIVGESAWSYSRGQSSASYAVRKRRAGLSPKIVAIAQRADHRLPKRYRALCERGKHKNKVVIAIGRELLGFVWAVATQAQMEFHQSQLSSSEAT